MLGNTLSNKTLVVEIGARESLTSISYLTEVQDAQILKVLLVMTLEVIQRYVIVRKCFSWNECHNEIINRNSKNRDEKLTDLYESNNKRQES